MRWCPTSLLVIISILFNNKAPSSLLWGEGTCLPWKGPVACLDLCLSPSALGSMAALPSREKGMAVVRGRTSWEVHLANLICDQGS